MRLDTDTASVVRDVLERHGGLGAGASRLRHDSNLYDAGLTSFASVNVMLALEEAFDVEFPDELLVPATFESIGALAASVDQLVDAR